MSRILVVEDNIDFAQVLLLHLQDEGYEVDHAADGEEGLHLALRGDYSLIILDLGLPKRDGLDLLKQLRKENTTVAVIVLSSRSEEIDTVVGLQLGADDYVTKPFRVGELMARIKALLRRSSISGGPPVSNQQKSLRFDNVEINLDRRTVIVDGAAVEFTCREFDILAFLAGRAGQAFSKEEILDNVWNDTSADYSCSLSNLVLRIRKKIKDDPDKPRLLQTVRGYGYRFASPEEL